VAALSCGYRRLAVARKATPRRTRRPGTAAFEAEADAGLSLGKYQKGASAQQEKQREGCCGPAIVDGPAGPNPHCAVGPSESVRPSWEQMQHDPRYKETVHVNWHYGQAGKPASNTAS